MSNFKVGDTVRIKTGADSWGGLVPGSVTTVMGVDPDDGDVRLRDPMETPRGTGWWYKSIYIEPFTGDAKVARRTFKLIKDTPTHKKGTLFQEQCDDGTQPYIVLFPDPSIYDNFSIKDRKLVEEQPQWFVEVFQVEPQYMTREELDQWEAFDASRPAKVKVNPKSDTAASTAVSPKYSGISEERMAKFVRAYNGSRSIKAVAEKMKIGTGTVYSYKHVAVKRGHTLKTMKRVRAVKKAA